jgi:hypothetical protein
MASALLYVFVAGEKCGYRYNLAVFQKQWLGEMRAYTVFHIHEQGA